MNVFLSQYVKIGYIYCYLQMMQKYLNTLKRERSSYITA